MSKMDKRIRVFWHETGHLVAGNYNEQKLGCYGAISVSFEYVINQDDYVGDTKIDRQKGFIQDGTPIYPAARIASIAYGCIFEAIQQDRLFSHCFDQNRYAHGFQDFGSIAGISWRYKLVPAGPVYKCIEEFYQKIKNNPEFEALFATDIGELVQCEEPRFSVDVESINKVVADFLPKHEPFYRELVIQLEKIFEPYLNNVNLIDNGI